MSTPTALEKATLLLLPADDGRCETRTLLAHHIEGAARFSGFSLLLRLRNKATVTSGCFQTALRYAFFDILFSICQSADFKPHMSSSLRVSININFLMLHYVGYTIWC